MSAPDVSVIVAVYNTMPYLTECLTSLTGQTIGAGRMQIVVIDDGSTDGSGEELDRFAARHPGPFTVVHQPNSGGPAGPFNRGLDAATGRYVFFIGADDHLGPDALRRMVTAADEWESDVLLGKVVGVNSRHIYQDIFAGNRSDVDLFDSALPRSLANTKLFRRSLLASFRIRYREDMKIGSDLPFTLEACYRARRISVLSDYDFYYAVRRFSATNITYLSRHLLRLETAQKIVEFVAGLIEPGKQRDAVMLRRFDHEIARLLEDDFRAADREVQQAFADGIGAIVRDHLTDEIAAQLNAETLIRLRVARDGTLDDLLAVIGQDATAGIPPSSVVDGRTFAAYPGYGHLPDACFDVTSSADWPVKLDASALSWERGVLVISAGRPDPLPAAFAVSAEDVPASVELLSPSSVRISLGADDLLAASPATGQRRVLSAQPGSFDPARAVGAATATGAAGAAAVRAPSLRRAVPLMRRRGTRLFVITPVLDASGRLMISVVPFTAARVRAAVLRRLRRP